MYEIMSQVNFALRIIFSERRQSLGVIREARALTFETLWRVWQVDWRVPLVLVLPGSGPVA